MAQTSKYSFLRKKCHIIRLHNTNIKSPLEPLRIRKTVPHDPHTAHLGGTEQVRIVLPDHRSERRQEVLVTAIELEVNAVLDKRNNWDLVHLDKLIDDRHGAKERKLSLDDRILPLMNAVNARGQLMKIPGSLNAPILERHWNMHFRGLHKAHPLEITFFIFVVDPFGACHDSVLLSLTPLPRLYSTKKTHFVRHILKRIILVQIAKKTYTCRTVVLMAKKKSVAKGHCSKPCWA